MKIYIAGPMRGKPRFNFDEFDAAAKLLKGAGHEPVNPADLDRACGFDPDRDAHLVTRGFIQDCMRRDLHALTECDAIMVLPGWDQSVGAKLEVATARSMGMCVYDRWMRNVTSLVDADEDTKLPTPDHVQNFFNTQTCECCCDDTPCEVTISFESGAVRSADAESVRYDLITPIGLRRLAETYKEGSLKYSDRNWEKGMPASGLINHAVSHVYKWLAGDVEEDHLAHAAWNLLAVLHFEELRPELIDIPSRQAKECSHGKATCAAAAAAVC